MTILSPDCELIADYATKGSEAAFRALVARHVGLVFATALRQVGDAGIAEEITQNVFVALARKSPRLGGFETLAGWLHRAAILESKARIRSELRRKRREELAAETASVQREGESPLAPLIPLLDEALLNLRDGDRLALVLRFLEDRNLREVGTALGVDEDAARKRVSRALDRLAEFFRKRGFVTPGVALFADAVKAAPAGLAVSAANAGIGAGGAVSGWGLALFHLMALTKTQTAVVCALIAAAPVAWEWHAQARVTRQYSETISNLELSQKQASDLEAELERTRKAIQQGEADILNSQARLALVDAKRSGKVPRSTYQWDDRSPYARLSKQLVKQLRLDGMARKGRLTEQMKDALQTTDFEVNQLEAALDHFASSFEEALLEERRRGESATKEQQNLRVQAWDEKFKRLRAGLFDQIDAILDAERAEILKKALSH